MMTHKINRKELFIPKGRILISTVRLSPMFEDEFRYETMVFGPDMEEWEQHRTFSCPREELMVVATPQELEQILEQYKERHPEVKGWCWCRKEE